MVMRPGVSVYVLGRFVAAIVALIALGICLSFAQTSTAAILGTVKDISGALIPGVSITVKHTESGLTRTVVSGERGGYNVPLLPVGPYELTTTMPGFKQVIRSGVNLVVGQEAVVDLTLEVGANAEQVTVTEEAPLVNTTTSSTSGVITEQQVKTGSSSTESIGSERTPPASLLPRKERAGNCWAWKPCGNSMFSRTPTAPSMENGPEVRSTS